MERRDVLKALCVLPLLPACGGGAAKAASGPVAAGNVSAVPVGTLKFVDGQPVILGRDAGGLYAMTAICTHEDCAMNSDGSITPTQVTCDCHGSHFDANGAVTKGPAGRPLDHYQVDLATDGTITVQAGTVVAATARTAVP